MDRDAIYLSFRKAHQPRPEMPYSRILNKPASQLTAEELQSLPEAKQAHEAEMQIYRVGMVEFNASIAAWWEKLRQDLAAHYGVTGHPKEPKLWEMAYEGPQDLEETLVEYNRLVTLLQD